VESQEELDGTLAARRFPRPDALMAPADTFFLTHAERLARAAPAQRLPVFGSSPLTEAGILASYGADPVVVTRRSATYVQRILKGAKPGDLPIELPTKFELVVNLRTAKALGLTVPQSLLLRADELIR